MINDELLAGISIVLRVVGVVLVAWGLWNAAGGLRVVVSGRIDERNRAASGLKSVIPLFLIGAVLFFFGMSLAKLR